MHIQKKSNFESKVDCEDLQPTFKYVTSYNRDGRFMTAADIERTSVNVLKPIIFIIDGFTDEDKRGDLWSKDLRDAYLEKFVHNVFIVDWNLPSPPDSASINEARSAGAIVADFIETIFIKTGEAYLEIHLVGVSLGYDVAVSAARRLSASSRRINRITGLDPSYYLIKNGTGSEGPSTENSDFVDVVHSNLSRVDETKQIAQVDFYLDGVGDDCDNSTCGISNLCVLFARSVNTKDIKARKCDNLEDFRKGACDNKEEVVFGENVAKTANGKYFVKY
ncbi:hypothetical protein NQ318_005194 [Aromia moschata]|uniref:Lipase domain-containing protein n=1 Tax=Aromia moschata TaxID=1265417 RepID=A0AAV8YEW3_9CUCU|nr:hypothetical protein NQ318_005194 [Aromia moschata]